MPQEVSKFKRPKRATAGELAKVGILLEDRTFQTCPSLRCEACGMGWSPMLQRGGHLPRGYWKCPNGCNG